MRQNNSQDQKSASASVAELSRWTLKPKRRLLLTLPNLRFHVNLGFRDFSGLGMGRPEPFDVCNNLTPHVPLFVCVRGILLRQPTSRTVTSRHIGEMNEGFREYLRILQQTTQCLTAARS